MLITVVRHNDALPGNVVRRPTRRERVPDEPHRLDQRRPERVELLPQVADVGLDDVRVAAEVVVPHVVEDLALRQHAARVQHQEAEQLELGARQLDRLVAAPHLARLLVERQVGEAHRPLVVAARAPEHRLHASHDLGEAERLRDVVVGEREARHLVLRGVLRGEEDHRHPLVAVAQPARDREAVEVGEHHVEHDQIGPERRRSPARPRGRRRPPSSRSPRSGARLRPRP